MASCEQNVSGFPIVPLFQRLSTMDAAHVHVVVVFIWLYIALQTHWLACLRMKLDAVNDCMRYRKPPKDLQAKVRSVHNHGWETRMGLDEDQMKMEDLHPHLRETLALHLNQGTISTVPPFQKPEPAFIAAVVVNMKSVTCLPGSYVRRKGQLGSEMFFISRGQVEVVSEDAKTVFATLKEGSFFGEIALVSRGKRTASVRAVGFCGLFVLHREEFDSVLADFPDQAEAILKAAEERYKLVRSKERASE